MIVNHKTDLSGGRVFESVRLAMHTDLGLGAGAYGLPLVYRRLGEIYEHRGDEDQALK